ncbi:polysaccharide biosynthesis protein [Actinoplanes regularis]|uniref:Membrane protein involved in the export of O-antigen and teichoic acid n=1 Tax=Actinoplanes regularis TaxID=52697 RepID=A0A238Z4M3_9ACTN|nr:polysaccharide biosynthesis protein [Actinoplanes regularis]GIE85820.1 hypothetical protein Are01nite_23000 [Actinoplanes regularis]SNR78286.1 hypothetical protein SAMN06264365_105434 [Actinoplanes regularis]
MDSSPGTRDSLTALGRAGLAVTAATATANLLAYLPPVLGARRLAPADLGALAAALALVAIATMPGIGLQTAVAVAVARSGGRVVAARQAWLTALICGAGVLAAAPVLRLPALLALLTVPAVLAGLPLGVLQGSERFGRLAVGTVLLAVGRYAGVLVGLVAGFGLTGSFALGALVAWAVVPALWWSARSRTRAGGVRGRAVFTAASASLAILVASYADLILARWLLPAGESGAYAVGAVLTRAAIWGPQVVTIVALPRLVRGGAALRVGLASVAAGGAVLVAGAALAGDLLVRAAGGDRYAALGGLAPYFVLVGALYAITVFLVNALIAAGARRPAGWVWAVAAGLVLTVVLVRPATVGQLLACALAAAATSALTVGVTVLTGSAR